MSAQSVTTFNSLFSLPLSLLDYRISNPIKLKEEIVRSEGRDNFPNTQGRNMSNPWIRFEIYHFLESIAYYTIITICVIYNTVIIILHCYPVYS